MHVDNEHADPAVLRLARIGPGQHRSVVAVLSPRRPHLLSAENPLIAVPDSSGLQAGNVGSGARLGEQLAPDLLAPQHRRQISLLLLLRAHLENRVSWHADADEEGPVRQVVVARLLAPDDLLHAGQPLAAVLLWPGDPGETGVEELCLECLLLRDHRSLAGALAILIGSAARRIGRKPCPCPGAKVVAHPRTSL